MYEIYDHGHHLKDTSDIKENEKKIPFPMEAGKYPQV